MHFQCLHGLGHGLLTSFHEFEKALPFCDKLGSPWEQQSCYGGVFMEHIVAAQAPHPHHTHPHYLKPEDHLYPCSAMDAKYQSACYLIQTAAILHLNNYDFAQSFRDCEQAPPGYIPVCYQSMGRGISGFTLHNEEQSIRLCLLGSEPYVKNCIEGVVKNVVNSEARPDPGLAFCRKDDVPYKSNCYRALGEAILTLLPDERQRKLACAQGEETQREVCMSAARVLNP